MPAPITQMTESQICKEFGLPVTPAEARLVEIEDETVPELQKLALVFPRSDLEPSAQPQRQAFVVERHVLADLARAILRQCDPTVEDQILDTLKEIKSALVDRSE